MSIILQSTCSLLSKRISKMFYFTKHLLTYEYFSERCTVVIVGFKKNLVSRLFVYNPSILNQCLRFHIRTDIVYGQATYSTDTILLQLLLPSLDKIYISQVVLIGGFYQIRGFLVSIRVQMYNQNTYCRNLIACNNTRNNRRVGGYKNHHLSVQSISSEFCRGKYYCINCG